MKCEFCDKDIEIREPKGVDFVEIVKRSSCDYCWDFENKIRNDFELAEKILKKVKRNTRRAGDDIVIGTRTLDKKRTIEDLIYCIDLRLRYIQTGNVLLSVKDEIDQGNHKTIKDLDSNQRVLVSHLNNYKDRLNIQLKEEEG